MSISPLSTRGSFTFEDFLFSPKFARDTIVNNLIQQVLRKADDESDFSPILRWAITREACTPDTKQISLPSFLIYIDGWKALLNLIAGKYFPNLSTHSISVTLDGRLLWDLYAEDFDDPVENEANLATYARFLDAEEKGAALQVFVAENEKLETLKIKYLPLPKEQLLRLFPVLGPHEALKKLDLSGNEFKNSDACLLLKAFSNKTATISVKLCDNRVTSLEELAPVILSGPFRKIDFSKNSLGTQGAAPIFRMLSDFPREPSLSILKLNDADLDSAIVPMICDAIKKNTSLTKLSLNGNRFNNEDVYNIISAALESSSLDVLEIKNNPINDEGFQNIKDLLLNKSDLILKSISIESDQILLPENRTFIAQILEAPYGEIRALGWSMGRFVTTTIWDRMQQQLSLVHGPLNSLDLTRQRQPSITGIVQRVFNRFQRTTPPAIEQGPPSEEDEPSTLSSLEIELD